MFAHILQNLLLADSAFGCGCRCWCRVRNTTLLNYFLKSREVMKKPQQETGEGEEGEEGEGVRIRERDRKRENIHGDELIGVHHIIDYNRRKNDSSSLYPSK